MAGKEKPAKKTAREMVDETAALRFEYLVNDVKLVQKPLRVKQIKDLVKLSKDLIIDLAKKSKGNTLDITINSIIDLITGDGLSEFMNIIFGGDASNIDWDDASFAEVNKIFKDFLALNPELKQLLIDYTSSLTSNRLD